MKDIKSFLIGFLMCTCIFLFMGKIKYDDNLHVVENQVYGKFQGFASERGEFLVDTRNGLMWSRYGDEWEKIVFRKIYK